MTAVSAGEFDPLLLDLLKNDRRAFSHAISLCESHLIADQIRSFQLVEQLADQSIRSVPNNGPSVAFRIGISGAPGVGKSTFINDWGLYLLSHLDVGHVARHLNAKSARHADLCVFAIDPSSTLTGGSLLGDKTRMSDLALESRAFVRPMPSLGEQGGLSPALLRCLRLADCFSFSFVLIETVGVGQAEVGIRDVCDFHIHLESAQAGDEVQSMKKGLLEHCDAVVVTKADGDHRAFEKAQEIEQSLHLSRSNVRVYSSSSLDENVKKACFGGLLEQVGNMRANPKQWLKSRRAGEARAFPREFSALMMIRIQEEFKAEFTSVLRSVEEGKSDIYRACEVLLKKCLAKPVARSE